MAINLVTKFSKLVLERFSKGSVTEGFFNRAYDADFVGAKTVQIHSINTVPMNDYTRSGSNRYGTPTELQDSIQELPVTQDRSFTFTIDAGNQAQQNYIKEAGRALMRQISEVVVPEVDTYRFGVISGKVPTANAFEIDFATQSAYDVFLDAQEALDNALVPLVGRVLWATPKFIKELKKDDNFIPGGSEAGQAIKFNGQIGTIDGVPIVQTPASRLPADEYGILAHPVALVSPMQLNTYQLHENAPGINGHLVEGRLIYDSFVLEGKEIALAKFVKNA